MSNRTSEGRSWRRLVASFLAMVATTTALVGLTPVAASADPDAAASDALGSWSVAGYDRIQVDRETRVTARSSDTNLVFRYEARSALRDGTVTLDLPRSAWPDDLEWWPWGLDYVTPGGRVVVRPHAGWPEQPGDCRGGSITWTVTSLAEVQRIVVEHVDCKPGEQLAVRIWGIATPRRPGIYRFPVAVDQAGGGETEFVGLRVHPKPSTRLSVRLPRQVRFDAPVTLTVTALRPGGRIDRSYRGSVALLGDRSSGGCVFDAGYSLNVYDFTAADAGVREIPVQLGTSGYRIVARDVDRAARPGRSNTFSVEEVPEDYVPVCPVSFH